MEVIYLWKVRFPILPFRNSTNIVDFFDTYDVPIEMLKMINPGHLTPDDSNVSNVMRLIGASGRCREIFPMFLQSSGARRLDPCCQTRHETFFTRTRSGSSVNDDADKLARSSRVVS